MTPPDPNSINWDQVAGWAAGIGGGLGAMAAAAWLAIQRVAKLAATRPASTITREDTKIVTTDSVAMHELAGSIEALTVTVREIHQLLNREIADREMDEEIERRARIRAEDIVREEEEAKEERRRPLRRPPG